MFFDKNDKRLKELQRKLERDGNSERLRKRFARLEAAGPVWVVSYYDADGRKREETCPAKYQSAKGAERYDALVHDRRPAERKVRRVVTEHTGRETDRNATMVQVVDYWLGYTRERLEARNNLRAYRTPRALGEAIKRHLGERLLSELDAEPEILTRHFARFPEKAWSQKTIWNYYVTLKTAINRWCKMKRIVMANPCDVVEVQADTNVQEYVPTEADFDKVIVASYTVGLPDEVRRLLVSINESGLRVNEVLKWRVESLDLSDPVYGEGGEPTRLPSYTTEISKQRRRTTIRLPMSRKLYETMREQVGQRVEGPVWKWKRPPYNLLKDAGLMAEAGVPFARPFHDYRKTVKHRLKVELGLSKEISKGFMGHASDAMDQYYTHLSTSDLYPAVAKTWTKRVETK